MKNALLILVATLFVACGDTSQPTPIPAPTPPPVVVPLPNRADQAKQQLEARRQAFAKLPKPPPDTRTPMQIAQAACHGAKQWRCSDPTIKPLAAAGPTSPSSWSVPNWFVDPVSGNDNNTCTTIGTPCKTKGEIIYRRWGTQSPILNGVTVTITYLSSETTGNDPGIFTPFFVNGASLTHFAAATTTFTGTLNVVTAKNVPGNQVLTSSFTVSSGAVVANMVLVNSTHSSHAIARQNLGSGVWQLDQPIAPYVAGTFPLPTGIDTWAHGDNISGFVPVAVNLVKIGGQTVDFSDSFPPTHVVNQITVLDPFGVRSEDTLAVDDVSSPLFNDCVVQRLMTVFGGSTGNQGFALNTAFQSLFRVSVNDYNGFNVAAGHFEQGATFKSGGAIVIGTTIAANISGPVLELGRITNSIGQVFLEAGQTALIEDDVDMSTGTSAFYGAGTIKWNAGVTLYSGSPATAFAASGGMQILGASTAYSYATSGGLTTVHNLALNPTNLAASAGATGFGGTAWGPGIVITNGIQP